MGCTTHIDVKLVFRRLSLSVWTLHSSIPFLSHSTHFCICFYPHPRLTDTHHLLISLLPKSSSFPFRPFSWSFVLGLFHFLLQFGLWHSKCRPEASSSVSRIEREILEFWTCCFVSCLLCNETRLQTGWKTELKGKKCGEPRLLYGPRPRDGSLLCFTLCFTVASIFFE